MKRGKEGDRLRERKNPGRRGKERIPIADRGTITFFVKTAPSHLGRFKKDGKNGYTCEPKGVEGGAFIKAYPEEKNQ